jgi:hypothetical protein
MTVLARTCSNLIDRAGNYGTHKKKGALTQKDRPLPLSKKMPYF